MKSKNFATNCSRNCRSNTCEYDVSERLAEIADGKSVDLEICGEHVCFQNGKFVWVMSPKYHAGFHAEAGIDGNEHYEIFTADKDGKFTRGNFVTEEEFFIVMIERGGCTIDTIKIITYDTESIDDPDKAYTLTVHVTNEDFRDYPVGDTIVKRFGTYARMWDCGTWLPRGGNWQLAHGSKTIATGNGKEDFYRFITCEYDVRERFAGMSDSNCFELEICGEYLSCQDFCRGGKGKCAYVWSPKYKAGFYAGACIDDNKRYHIYTGAGMTIRRKFLTDEEFFNLMEKRGGCTIDTDTVKNSAEAWTLLKKRYTGEFKFSAKFTPPDGITTATYYNREANLRLDVTSDDGEEFHFAVCEIDNQPFVIYSIDIDSTLDEDEFAKVPIVPPDMTEEFHRRFGDTTNAMNERQHAILNLADAQRKFDAAEKHATEARRDLLLMGNAIAKKFDGVIVKEFVPLKRKMTLVTQSGETFETDFTQFTVTYYDGKFNFEDSFTTLAVYTYPEEVTGVINELKAAIARGDIEFTFPTVDAISKMTA